MILNEGSKLRNKHTFTKRLFTKLLHSEDTMESSRQKHMKPARLSAGVAPFTLVSSFMSLFTNERRSCPSVRLCTCVHAEFPFTGTLKTNPEVAADAAFSL